MFYADDLPTVLKFRLLNKGWYAYWTSFAFAACMAPFWKHLDLKSLGACRCMIRVETLRLLLEGNPSRSQRGARQWVETVQVLQHTWDPAKFLGSASIALLISNCPNMRTLDLSGCDKLENLTKTLAIVGRNNGLTFTHGKLETLNLSGCRRLNSTDLCVFLHLFPHLKYLNLTECFNVAHVGFVGLGEMGSLEVLSVRDCPQFDNFCIGPLLLRCSRLRELDMSGTKVSSRGWAEVNQGAYHHSGESLEMFVASKMRLSSGREMDWLLRMAKLRKVVMKDIQGLAPRNFERLKNVLICKGYERLEISRAPSKKPLSF
ncbi:hypothetical protein SpCBS45565_g01982 [Spizellomyces sp. 'palustris']|nr:hypothetical protein SpCBS45565_g01982 [Spizellomyces sp. 'palustris']